LTIIYKKMIITKNIKINITSRNITYYKNNGYNIKFGDQLNIQVSDLNPGSPTKIEVCCDFCENVKIIQYRLYINNINNSGKYYCNKCKHKKSKLTKLTKYGDENYNNIKQTKSTKLKIYGDENYTNTKQMKSTKLKKYGDEKYNNNKKTKTTKLEKYNNENYNNTEKHKKTCLIKYGVDNISKLKKTTINKRVNKKIKLINLYEKHGLIDIDYNTYEYICECKTKNNIFKIPKTIFYNRLKTKSTLCTICNPIDIHISDKENKLYDFIKENYNGEISTSNRKILNGKELDVYLPDLKLAFEFNGLYWHNELYKTTNYHLNKTELCEKVGIQLIHIWEDDWLHKQDIIKSMILNKLNKTPNKIYGRKTEIKEITNSKLIRSFLEKNHLQGFVGSKIKLGLFFENELISLMTFGKRRIALGKKTTNDDEWELLRFCNKLNTNVLGSASKLFKHFKENYNPKEITTYADRSHSNGGLYKQLGFNFIKNTSPNYYYIINDTKLHRFNFRKDKLIKDGFDPNKTEHEIMLDRKIFRIYDSGNLKYFINFQKH